MIDSFKHMISSEGKVIALCLLFIASLWHHPVFAEQRSQEESLDSAAALLGDIALSDGNLDAIRGQGLKASAPEHHGLAVILWDEGPTNKGTRSSLGNQVSTITVRISVEDH